tara:strand:+ start:378 stop:821 length:444 start_codon:yes stop_codon:yes gene_type:complete
MIKKIIVFTSVIFLSCSTELKGELLLDQIDGIVWTRGSNFKVFKNNPFRLILVEDGICLNFSESATIIRDNEFKYTLLESGRDTIRLGYKVTGEKLNHCGTFTYFLDLEGSLIRTYEECGSFYEAIYKTSFFEAEQNLYNLCPDLDL